MRTVNEVVQVLAAEVVEDVEVERRLQEGGAGRGRGSILKAATPHHLKKTCLCVLAPVSTKMASLANLLTSSVAIVIKFLALF